MMFLGEKQVDLLLEKYKDDVVMLDALNMWAMNPTSKSAGYGIEQNNKEVVKNMESETRNLRSKIERLIDRSKNDEISFCQGTLKNLINEKFGEKLRNEVIRRIEELDRKEKRFIYLYLKYRGGRYYGMEGVSAAYYVSWGEEPPFDNVDSFRSKLTKLGLLNPLFFRSSSDRSERIQYLIPDFLKPLFEDADKFVVSEKPVIPDVRSYIEELFEQGEYLQLQSLDLLVELGGSYREGFYNFKSVKEKRGIVGKYGGIVTISPFVLEDLKIILQEKKREVIDKLNKLIEKRNKNTASARVSNPLAFEKT